jgi:hypothetical protein
VREACRLTTSFALERVRCGVYEYGRGSAKKLALEDASVIATCIGVALVIAFSLPAEAKNKPKSPVSTEVIIPDPANGEPMTLIVSLRDQTLDVYQGTLLIASSKVSTQAMPPRLGCSVFSKRGGITIPTCIVRRRCPGCSA